MCPVMRSTSSHPPRCHYPSRGRRGFARQIIVHAESAPHHEQAFGDVMRRTQSRFPDPAIHVQGAHLQVKTLGFVGSDAPLDRASTCQS